MINPKNLLLISTILLCVMIFTSCVEDDTNVDAPPVIMFQNSIYGTSGIPSEYSSFREETRVYEGEIKSATKNGEMPTENFQANWQGYVGCSVYTSKDIPNYIFVLSVDDEGLNNYSIFKKSE